MLVIYAVLVNIILNYFIKFHRYLGVCFNKKALWIGDLGLGCWDFLFWIFFIYHNLLSQIPNPQSPIPNPQLIHIINLY